MRDEEEIEDDRLRLIFTCCHPALPPEGQVALTLREICGLTTEEIARAFLVTPATLAQRIVRAKAVIREKAIPYQVPVSAGIAGAVGSCPPGRVSDLQRGIFGGETSRRRTQPRGDPSGPTAARPAPGTRGDGPAWGSCCCRSRAAPPEPLPTESLILLEQQDRSLWNRDQIAEGISLTESALASRRFGAYTLQAAIAAVHAETSSAASTDWRQITLLYDRLIRIQPSPVVELNRAVAIAMYEGPEQGLRLIDDLLARERTRQLSPRALCPRGSVSQAGAASGGPCFV